MRKHVGVAGAAAETAGATMVPTALLDVCVLTLTFSLHARKELVSKFCTQTCRNNVGVLRTTSVVGADEMSMPRVVSVLETVPIVGVTFSSACAARGNIRTANKASSRIWTPSTT